MNPGGMNFPYTEESVLKLLKKFDSDENFSLDWHWASYHKTGMTALKWSAEKNMTASELYTLLEDLSCPAPPQKFERRFGRAGLLDLDNRIWALNPATAIEVTFKTAGQNMFRFQKKVLILSVDDLLKRKPQVLTDWRPSFEEDQGIVEKWLSKDQSLLKSFQGAPIWDRLKVVEALIGVTKALSVVKFQRITKI